MIPPTESKSYLWFFSTLNKISSFFHKKLALKMAFLMLNKF